MSEHPVYAGQQITKWHKALQLLGLAVMVLGGIAAITFNVPDLIVLVLAGILVTIVGRGLAWWHHG